MIFLYILLFSFLFVFCIGLFSERFNIVLADAVILVFLIASIFVSNLYAQYWANQSVIQESNVEIIENKTYTGKLSSIVDGEFIVFDTGKNDKIIQYKFTVSKDNIFIDNTMKDNDIRIAYKKEKTTVKTVSGINPKKFRLYDKLFGDGTGNYFSTKYNRKDLKPKVTGYNSEKTSEETKVYMSKKTAEKYLMSKNLQWLCIHMRKEKYMSEENIALDDTKTKKQVMKRSVKTTLLIVLSLLAIIATGAIEQTLQVPEGTELYKQDIDVEVVKIDKMITPRSYGLGSIDEYYVDITVYSEKFNTTEEFRYSDLFYNKYYEVEKGDIIQAELYTYKNKKTGEIVKRQINELLWTKNNKTKSTLLSAFFYKLEIFFENLRQLWLYVK